MAISYLIVSKETYTSYLLPDTVALYFGLPITETDVDGNVVSKTWTLKSAYSESGNSAGNPFPIIDQGEGIIPIRIIDEENGGSRPVNETEATDYVCPLGSTGGDLHLFVKALADAKPVPYNHVMLSSIQIRTWLLTGSLPDPLV